MRGTLGARRAAAANRHRSGSEPAAAGAPHRGMGHPACVRVGARVPAVGGHDGESTVPQGPPQGSLTQVILQLSCDDPAPLRVRAESGPTRQQPVKTCSRRRSPGRYARGALGRRHCFFTQPYERFSITKAVDIRGRRPAARRRTDATAGQPPHVGGFSSWRRYRGCGV